jgi:hypothetical protein
MNGQWQADDKKLASMINICVERAHISPLSRFFRGRHDLTHKFYGIMANIVTDPSNAEDELISFKLEYCQYFNIAVAVEDPDYRKEHSYSKTPALEGDFYLHSDNEPPHLAFS